MTDLMQPDAVERRGARRHATAVGPANVPRNAGRRWSMAGSLLAGLVAATALVTGPLRGWPRGRDHRRDPARVRRRVGASGRAVGALDRPAAAWAPFPAAAMALTGAGLIVLAPGAGTLTALGWIWPPLLLALVRLDDRARTPPAL